MWFGLGNETWKVCGIVQLCTTLHTWVRLPMAWRAFERCIENRIVEERLMRDNAHLVTALDVHQTAQKQAQRDLENGNDLVEILASARKRVKMNTVRTSSPTENGDISSFTPASATSKTNLFCSLEMREFAETLFATLWLYQDLESFMIIVSAHI